MVTTLALLTLLSAPGQGKKVSLEFSATPANDVLAVLSDISKKNLIALEKGEQRVELHVKDLPWDDALPQVVKQLGLETREVEGAVLVGTAAKLAAFDGTFARPRGTLFAKGADPAGALEVLSLTAGASVSVGPTQQRLTVTLRNVKADFAARIVSVLVGAPVVVKEPRPPREKGCAAPTLPRESLQLTAVASGTATPAALVEDDVGVTWLIRKGDCLSSQPLDVKAVVRDALSAGGKTWEVGVEFDPMLVRLTVDEALEASTSATLIADYDRMLLTLLRDVVRVRTVVWKKDHGADFPSELIYRLEAAVLDGARVTPAQAKPFVATVRKHAGLMSSLTVWVLLEAGELKDAKTELEKWIPLVSRTRPEPMDEYFPEGYPGQLAARKMLALATTKGLDVKALSAQLEASIAAKKPR